MSPGEKSLRGILFVWKMEADAGPMTAPVLADGEPFVDDRDRAEWQGYVDEWDAAHALSRHAEIVERVAFTEGLLRLWDALATGPEISP